MNARYYDPQIGQFISPDSLVPDPTVLIDYNRYAYARANPLRYFDPNGHQTVDTVGAVRIQCFLCNMQLLDYSGVPGWLDGTVDNLAWVGCLLAGCHADAQANTITGPTEEEYVEQITLSLITSGMTPMGMVKIPAQITTRASGWWARRFVNRTTNRALNRIISAGTEGSIDIAKQAAKNNDEILPGIFQYSRSQVTSISGYAQHHLWPQAMGGPLEGLVIYVRQPHTASGALQDRLNTYLRTSLGMAQRELEAWGRENPSKLLPYLREFYKQENIPFPY